MAHTKYDKKAVLSRRRECHCQAVGEPRDAAVNFDINVILQRHRVCGFPGTARPSCWSLSADCSESSVKK